ncbi:MAG TPA: hypothetical protein VFU05_14330 [Cyclobacteriaceae bacterium]|nr:hypothetical protein [Cyclobacteriaceae bacterium]
MRILSIVLIAVIHFSATAQLTGKVLPPIEIIKLIPQKINGFHLSADPQSKLIKLGTLQYCMAEKNFSASSNRSIKILLFDYKEAPIMYNQATRRLTTYTNIETDAEIRRPIALNDCIGWESYDAGRKNSQILVGIFNRFYLTIEGKNVDLESLKKVFQEFKIDTFPK